MNEIFKAIFDRLTLQLTENVYDHVPQDLADSEYPYVRVDAVQPSDNGTDTETGFIAELQIVSFSRYLGLKEINDLTDSIYNALHRWPFPDTTTFGISGIREILRNTNTEQDGLTRNGVQRFEITFEPLPIP